MNNKDLLLNIAEIDKATAKIKGFINSLVDVDSFVETDVFLSGRSFNESVDALGEGVVTGYATINGNPIQLFAQNAEVLKGSLSQAHAAKISKVIKRACETHTPLISIIDSCGARVGDGTSIMEGYASIIRDSVALAGEVPHICIIKGVSVGMMTTFAASADFVFMSKDAIMSVNSPMYLVSDAKTFPVDYKEKLGYKAYKKHTDLAQFTYSDEKDLSKQLLSLIDVLYDPQDTEINDNPNRVNPNLEKVDAIDAVKYIVDEDTIIEYCSEYASEVGCSLAKLNGISVGIIATKGDYITADGLEKAADFISKLDSYNIPLITLVDTKGIDSNLDVEYKGVAKKSLDLMVSMAASSIVKIGVAYGNAIGYGYSALMSKAMGFGYTLATTKAKIAPVSEEISIAMMADQLKDKNKENLDKLSKDYVDMQLNPIKSAKEGYIDNVVEATNLRPYIASALLMLLGI